MGFKLSTGLRNYRLGGGALRGAFQNGALLLYSGTQPATADTAASGTLLCKITNNSGAKTDEVCGTGTVTLTGGAAGTVDSITVNSVQLLASSPYAAATAVAYTTDLTTTATNTAAQINLGTWHHKYSATSSGAVITLTRQPGAGTSVNTHVVAFTGTTITATTANIAGGVNPANGLLFGAVTAGVLDKSGTWSGVNLADGTVGWARFVGSVADAGGTSTTAIRLDMDAATAGAILTMASTTLTNGATTTIDSVALTEPAA